MKVTSKGNSAGKGEGEGEGERQDTSCRLS